MSEFTKAQYTDLMAQIDGGAKLDPATFAELKAFAKKAKVKQPPADAVLTAEDVAAADVTKERKPRAKGPKAQCSVTVDVDPKMTDEKCQKPARTGGMCTMHWTRLVYRANPENMEKARLASKKYAQKVREAKAATKAALEAASA